MSALRTVGLTCSFGALRAVAGVDLSVETGELRAIIGPNGAGKTSLFNLLTGRLSLSAGRIFVSDREATGLPPHAISRLGVARTFQRTNVFPGLSARENVRIAAQSRRHHLFSLFRPTTSLVDVGETADRVIDEIGLDDLGDRLATELAYGDQRLLEIGIALATAPRLLLLDEPMAGMSPGETERTAQLIRRLAGRITVILIEHDMDVVLSISDRITVLHQGAVIAEGTPQQIQADLRVQDAYLGRERSC